MHYNPILSKRLQPGAWAVTQSEINHLVNRSRGLNRTQCALSLRSLCATAGSQRIIRRAERCNPNKEEKKEKNEQPEELEAFTINYLQLFLKKIKKK